MISRCVGYIAWWVQIVLLLHRFENERIVEKLGNKNYAQKGILTPFPHFLFPSALDMAVIISSVWFYL